MVTAKFRVSRVTPNVGYELTEVEMTPDYVDGRNKEWAKYTPSGVIRMAVYNPVAEENFPLGKSLTITFTSEE